MDVQGGKGLVVGGFGNDLPQGLSLRPVVGMEAVFHVTYMAKSRTVSQLFLEGVLHGVHVVSLSYVLKAAGLDGTFPRCPVSRCPLSHVTLRPSEVAILVMPIVIETFCVQMLCVC